MALWLERRLTKREILELYFDRAYLGEGVYGMQAAAEYYFHKSVRDIDLAEAAILAGLLKAPSRYAANVRLRAVRAKEVLHNLVAAGFMQRGEVLAAQRELATQN